MIGWKMLTKRLDLVVSSSLSMVLKHYETDHGMVYKMALPDPETINPYRTKFRLTKVQVRTVHRVSSFSGCSISGSQTIVMGRSERPKSHGRCHKLIAIGFREYSEQATWYQVERVQRRC